LPAAAAAAADAAGEQQPASVTDAKHGFRLLAALPAAAAAAALLNDGGSAHVHRLLLRDVFWHASAIAEDDTTHSEGNCIVGVSRRDERSAVSGVCVTAVVNMKQSTGHPAQEFHTLLLLLLLLPLLLQ
jgi:hypothetical protein